MIKFSHVIKKFDNFTPIKDIDGEVKKGAVVSIIGPSGVGKSTLLRMVNGLEKPTDGKVYVDDIEVNDKSRNAITRKVGMLFQSYNLFNHLNVIENLMIAQVEVLKRDKQESYEKGMELLKEVGLESKENSLPSELSGGEKQRVAFARALAVDPEVMLLDEPTSALDPNSVTIIKNLILNLAKSGKTILVVTHSMELAKDISNRVFYLDEGIIYEEGSPEEIFENPKKEKTQNFINKQNTIEFEVNKYFDYDSALNKIFEFCDKHNVGNRKANRIILVFEEIKGILSEKYDDPDINVKISLANNEADMIIKYKGEKSDINETRNDISLKLINGLVSKYEYAFDDNDEYKNKLSIVVKG